MSISSLDLFITETHEVITLEDEPTDPEREPEVMSCHMAAGMREETTTFSAFVDVKDAAKGMANLLPARRSFGCPKKHHEWP